MIKDLIVTATIDKARGREPVHDLGCGTFTAHVGAVAFNYEPVIPPSAMSGILSSMTVPVLMSH
jgi:hypothetical protein